MTSIPAPVLAGDAQRALWDYYCRHPYLPRLPERAVLDAGIAGDLAWDIQGFAVASGRDEATGRFTGLAIPQQDVVGQITDSTLLMRPDLARAQLDAEVAERAAAAAPAGQASEAIGVPAGRDAAGQVDPAGGSRIGDRSAEPQPVRPRNKRFFGVAVVSPHRCGRPGPALAGGHPASGRGRHHVPGPAATTRSRWPGTQVLATGEIAREVGMTLSSVSGHLKALGLGGTRPDTDEGG